MGRLGGELVEHLGHDNPAQLKSWLDAQFSRGASRESRAEFEDATLAALKEGGVDLVQARASRRGDGAVIVLKGSRSSHHVLVVLEPDPADPVHLHQALFTATQDPHAYDGWPDHAPSRETVASLIHARLDTLVELDDFSGCVSVADEKRTWFQECRGLADRSFAIPTREDTRFHIGSMDKMFTAVAIAQLVEGGKVSWDSPLGSLLPEYPDHDAAAKMTVWQLLHHQAGLGDFFVPEFFEHRERFVRPGDYVDLIARQPKVGAPGQQWAYSNAGFVLLGRIIERVSGEPYDDYVRRHIFEVVHMNATGFDSQEDIVPNLAVGYFRDDPFAVGPWKANWMTLPFKGSPAGGGFSTTQDLLRFAFALQDGRIVRPTTLAQMFDREVEVAPGIHYATGIEDRTVNGRHVRGHNGGAPGMNAALGIVWETSQAVAVTSNQDGPAGQSLADHVADLLASQPNSADLPSSR